jgi:hypothetical protein
LTAISVKGMVFVHLYQRQMPKDSLLTQTDFPRSVRFHEVGQSDREQIIIVKRAGHPALFCLMALPVMGCIPRFACKACAFAT